MIPGPLSNAPQNEFYSKEFSKVLPPENAQVIPNSFHMTFLSACKPDFPKDDPELSDLCVNNDQKLKIQQQVLDKTRAFLRF